MGERKRRMGRKTSYRTLSIDQARDNKGLN